MKGKNHDLTHDLTFSAHTINCVCHSVKSMFRVFGIYNFVECENAASVIHCCTHIAYCIFNHHYLLWLISVIIKYIHYFLWLRGFSHVYFQKITTFLVFGNSLPQLYRHCVLHFQPPFSTLIDFCYPSTYIHYFLWLGGFSHVYFQKMDQITSYVKIDLLYFLFFHECPIYIWYEEKNIKLQYCATFFLSRLH